MTRVWVMLGVLLCGLGLRAATPPPAATSAPAPAGQPAASLPCAGELIAAVRVVGCVSAACTSETEQILTLTGLRTGMTVAPAQVELAVRRLVQTGLFADATVSCEAAGVGEARLVVALLENWQVRDVDVDGAEQVYEDEVLKRVFIRPGAALDPRPERLAETLERQSESIRRQYAREGFDSATVQCTAEPLGGGRARVRIRIDEGPKRRIQDIRVTVERRASAPPRGDCAELKAPLVRRLSGLKTGQIYTPGARRRAEQELRAALKRGGFVRPSAKLDWQEAEGRVDIAIVADVCVDVRIFVRDASPTEGEGLFAQRVTQDQGEGFEPSDEPEALAVLPFSESGTFDFDEADLGRQALLEHYQRKGYLFAEVDLEQRSFDEHPRPPKVADDVVGTVHYFVTLSQIAEIREIRFSGNRAFSRETIESWIETRPYDFFDSGGYLLAEPLMWDLERIAREYQDAGYLHFRLVGCRRTERLTRAVRVFPERVRHRYHLGGMCFDVSRYTGEPSIYIDVAFDEGPRSEVSALLVGQHRGLTEEQVREAFGLKAGDAFSKKRVLDAIDSLKRRYYRDGFGGVEIGVEATACQDAAGAAGQPCNWRDTTAQRVALRVDIRAGRKHSVGEVFVAGNFRTKKSLILRDLPNTGEVFDPSRIQDGLRKLRNLGIFNSIEVRYIGLDEKPSREQVALVVAVEERTARFVDLAVGFETLNRQENMPEAVTQSLSAGVGVADLAYQGHGESLLINLPDLLFTFEVQYVDKNVFGRAKELYLPVKYGFSTTAWDRHASFSPTLYDSRFFGVDLQFRLMPYVLYDRAQWADDRFKTGVQFELSKMLADRLYSSLQYEVGWVKFRRPGEADYQAGQLQNTLSPRISWDRRDNPVNPTAGWLLSGTLSYINALDVDLNLNNFLKTDVNAKFFFSIRKLLVFGVHLRYGDSVPIGGGDLPDNERFRLGGSAGLRGFDDDSVNQYDAQGNLVTVARSVEATCPAGQDGACTTTRYEKRLYGDTVLSGSLEARFPILRKLGIWGGLFFDFGALSESLLELHWKSFRTSAGVGVRYLVGGQIPIRFDYGIVLDRRCKNIAPDTGTCVEKEEVGSLHFGLLYTF